jgi:ABC-2 type transport system permease protein
MLGRITRHEWRQLAADRTLVAVAVLFALVAGYAIANGARFVDAQVAERAQADAAYAERLRELRSELEARSGAVPDPFAPDPGSPRYLGGLRQDVFLPPTPLAALAIGQADLLPSKVTANIWTARRSVTRNYEVANPLNLLAGRFDLAFAVVYLFPLVILALSYGLLSGEREQGTLALVLSQPVRLGSVVAGKLAARFALVVGLGGLLTLAGAALVGVPLLSAHTLPRLLLWGAAVVLYGAFWFALAVLVAARGRSSANNAMVLAGAWLLLVVVAPALVNALAASRYDVPSRSLLIGALREASNEVSSRGAALLAKYYQDHPEMRPAGQDPDLDDFTTRYFTVEQQIEADVAPVLERYDRSLREQQALVGRLSFLSPAIAVQEALNEITGTGAHRQRSFQEQALAFADAKKSYFMPRVFRRERLTSADYDTLPSFVFEDESAGGVARRVLPGLLAVAAAAAALALLSARALRSYSVAGS